MEAEELTFVYSQNKPRFQPLSLRHTNLQQVRAQAANVSSASVKQEPHVSSSHGNSLMSVGKAWDRVLGVGKDYPFYPFHLKEAEQLHNY